MIKAVMHKIFNSLGLEIRLLKNLREAQKREKKMKELEDYNRKYYSGFSLPIELVDELVSNDIELQLPLRKLLTNRTEDMTGWASHYGGLDVLYRYCRGIPGLIPAFDAMWQHGCAEPWLYKKYPRTLVYNTECEFNKLILVANEDQRAFIQLAYRVHCQINAPIHFVWLGGGQNQFQALARG